MKFRIKIALATVILISLVFGAGAGALLFTSFRTSLEREKEAALTAYRTVADALSLTEAADRTAAPAVLLRQFASGGAKTWTGMWLREEDGTLSYHWGNGKEASRKEEDAGITEKSGYRLLVDDAARGEEQIRIVGKVGSAAFGMTFDLSSVYRVREEQEKTYLVLYILTVTVSAALAYLAARFLTRPLSDLTKAARAISDGDLSARAPEGGDDETGELSRAFNAMAGSVEKSVETVREEAEKKERFLGFFAHEAKTPMTSVIGYADLIRSGTLEGAEARDAAAWIFSEGKRLENLSAKLLELLAAGREEPELRLLSPAELVREYVRRNAPLAEEKGIALEEECEEGKAMLDEDLFLSLLGNLSENAARVQPEGGRIRLSVRMTPDGFLLAAADDGPGIPPEAVGRLTEAFYRVDKARSRKNGGAGLGLTLCEKIAEMHGGSLSFSSGEGKGTVVTARFAAGRGDAAADGEGGGKRG